MGRWWLTFWMAFTACAWLLTAVLMVAAVVADDYGRAGFNLALVLVNTMTFAYFASERIRS